MAQFEKWFTVDLMNTLDKVKDIGTLMFTGDNNSHKIGVILLNNRVPQNVVGSVVGLIIRSDGYTVMQNGAKEGNKAWIELPESAFVKQGRIIISLKIVNGEEKTVVLCVSANVKISSTEEIIDPGHVIPDITDVIAKLEEMDEAIEDCEGATANAEAAQSLVAVSEVSSTASVEHIPGMPSEYFIYNGNLCHATQNIAQGGSIVTSGTGKNCENVTVGGELAKANAEVSELKSAFDLVSKNLYGTETQTDKSNTNYCLVDTLVYGKTYRIGVSVATAGNYGVKVATDGSASYVVATLLPDNTPFSANEKKYVLYTPVGNGEKYIRLSSNTVSWSVYVSEVIDAEEIESEINSITGRTSTLETDVEKIENDLEDTNDYIESFTKTQGSLQLFDYRNCDVFPGIFQGASTTFASLDRGAIITVCEINGLTGETYTYNCISDDSYATMGIEKVEILASNNAIPVVGESYLQVGSSNQTTKRGTITLGQNTKYLLFSVIIPSGLARVFDFSTLLSKIVVRKGAYDTTYYPYRLLNVTEPDLSEEIRNKLNQTGDVNAYRQILTQTLHVGQSVLTEQSASLGTGWSGTIADGLAHTSGSTDPVSFNIATENNSSYLISFTLSNTAEKSVTVGIGDSALVDVYNGTTSVNVGIVADGGYLKIVPSSAWVGTITNLKLRKVGETGDEIELEVKNVDTKVNDPSLTGFWNVIVGVNNFSKNQNGSRNISIGYASLSKLESGTRNICIGTFSMPYVKDGDRNIAIGADSLYSTRGHSHAHAEDCIAIGYRAMSDGTNIKYNVAIGTNAMKESADTATYNVCVGAGAGTFANYGLTAIGYNACAKSYTKADASVFVGRNSGVDNTGATAQSPKNVSNAIAIGDGVLVKNTNDARFGNASNVIFLAGKRIVFNDDHTVTWEDDT